MFPTVLRDPFFWELYFVVLAIEALLVAAAHFIGLRLRREGDLGYRGRKRRKYR
jgi:hypothetical protein